MTVCEYIMIFFKEKEKDQIALLSVSKDIAPLGYHVFMIQDRDSISLKWMSSDLFVFRELTDWSNISWTHSKFPRHKHKEGVKLLKQNISSFSVYHIGTFNRKNVQKSQTDYLGTAQKSPGVLYHPLFRSGTFTFKGQCVIITLLIFEGLLQVFWEVSGDGHSFVVVGSRFSGSGSVKHKESQKM